MPRRSSVRRPDGIDADVQTHNVLPGQKVWVPDKEACWILTTVAGSFSYGKATVTTADGVEIEVDLSSLRSYDATHELMLSDISDMNDLHEAPLLSLLKRRYQSDRIHTWCTEAYRD